MSQKTIITIGMFVGSFVGGYIPSLWGAGMLSYSTLFASAVGAVAGIWLAYRLTR